MSANAGALWSAILAGGEGERTRAFIEERFGYPRPKQYCAFTGSRSLFQHTVDRADALAPAERRVVVAAPGHREIVLDQLRGRGEGHVILQPRNRGTAPGTFLALSAVLARDPEAVVVIHPSDHFVYPESAFLNVVRNAVRLAERHPRETVLLGVRPSGPEADYGWILPSSGNPLGLTRGVEAFLEKPSRVRAEDAYRRGGLWNTMILASRAATLWDLGWRCVPEIMPAFVELRDAFRSGIESAVAEEIYRAVPSRDLSFDLLQKAPERLMVLEMSGVWWSDWGRPERILETLKELERSSQRSAEPVLELQEAR